MISKTRWYQEQYGFEEGGAQGVRLHPSFAQDFEIKSYKTPHSWHWICPVKRRLFALHLKLWAVPGTNAEHILLRREVKCKHANPWYKLYEKSGFWDLISSSGALALGSGSEARQALRCLLIRRGEADPQSKAAFVNATRNQTGFPTISVDLYQECHGHWFRGPTVRECGA